MFRASVPYVFLLLLLAGCDNSHPMDNLYPLGGTILREGKPVKEGGMILVPDGGSSSSLIVNAAVEANGTFTVRTERTLSSGKLEIRPGAPAGRYRVIYHPASNGATMGLEVELPERVTVEPGGADIRLQLPAVMPKGRGEERDDNPLPANRD